MKQKVIVTIMGLIVFLAIGVVAGKMIYDYMAPSKERVELKDIYNVPQGEVKIFIDDEMWDKNGILMDGKLYMDYETINEKLTQNFYYDSNEKLLITTTVSKNVVVSPDSVSYTVNGENQEFEGTIFTIKGEVVYISMDFVTLYGEVEYSMYESPYRAMVYSDFEKDYLCASVSEDTEVRVEGDKKSSIIVDLKEGDKVHIKAEGTELSKGYVGVLTNEGVVGYVKEDVVKESYYEKMATDYEEEVYGGNERENKVNLTWHAVYTEVSASAVKEIINNSPGVNVVSPTWFRLTDDEGNISSIANRAYVDAAHEKGVEVWALISDVEHEINTLNLFSYTSKRTKLINRLIELVKEYNIDGINVDIETITSKSAPHYVQFLKELSVRCHEEGIVLSVDSYVPMPFNEFYRRDIQGKYADYVVVMAYDEHYAGSAESGSVSSISWVTNAVNDTKEVVPANKIIIGIPFYTRLWEEKKNSDGSVSIVSVQSISMDTANEVVAKNSATVVFNEETGQDYVQYEKGGSTYKMWMENAKSIKIKLKAIKEGGCGGVASWRAGFETKDIWQVIEDDFMK